MRDASRRSPTDRSAYDGSARSRSGLAIAIARHLDLALALCAAGGEGWRIVADGAALLAERGSPFERRAALRRLAAACRAAASAKRPAAILLLEDARVRAARLRE